MSDYTFAPFYAVTGIGYGKGFTVDEALDNYREAQRRNFSHLSDDELDEAWGFVWAVPETTVGFAADSTIWWELDDGTRVKSDASQRVAEIGRVPDFAKLVTS